LADDQSRRKRQSALSLSRPTHIPILLLTSHPYAPQRRMKGSKQGACCYRVSDSSSITPFSQEHGFTAHHDMFIGGTTRPISGRAFKAVPTPSYNESALDQSVVDHVLGGWASHNSNSRESKWISTTASHEWAVWETARRLVSEQVSFVDVSTVATYTKYSPRYRGARQHRLTVVPFFEERGYSDRNRFMALARSSSEVLYLGRIFPKDIQNVERWTLNVSRSCVSLHEQMLIIRTMETGCPKSTAFP
jgi:hypothetical protein